MGYRAVMLNTLTPEERGRVAGACFDAAADGHPLFGILSHRYYEEYAQAHEVFDAVVLRDGAPVLFMPLSGSEERLSYFGLPARAFPVPAGASADARSFEALHALLQAVPAERFPRLWMIEDARLGGTVVQRELCEIAIADLALPEAAIRSGLRKSYKSLVNWGLRNLELLVIDREHPDYEKFCAMRDFHRAVAGRATRSDLTWDLQFEMIREGAAYAVLGWLENRLVAASMVIHGTRSAYYGVGIYDRELMAAGKPVGHASVFRAILHARALGLQDFILGDVAAHGEHKADNIALFKKGFATRMLAEPRVVIELA